MNDPVQLLIDAGAIPSTPFGAQSRYHGVALAVVQARPGEPARVYVRRRFVSMPGAPGIAAHHVVVALERPDLLGAKYFGDPLLYWRIADANAVVDPNELTDALGRRVLHSIATGDVNLQRGIKLQLLIGPVPVPAPQEVVEALASVKVENGAGGTQSGFELTFELPARSPLRTLFLLTGGGSLPLMRVVLVVHLDGKVEAVIDGVTTNVETQPGEGGVSSLVVKGKDMSALMDVIELTGLPYPAMTPAARVLLVLAKYAAFGVIPVVIPSIVEDPPVPVQRIPQQRGSDYAYVTRLARECGYVFYLEPGPAPATSRAYWGPEIRVGEPQPALSVNMDAITNVEQLTFNFDKESKTMPIVYFQEPNSKAPIGVPIPDVSPLNPPLGLVPPLPPKTVSLDDTAHMSPVSALMSGLAYAGQNSDSVFGNGRLDVSRYGRLLKSRQLVGVRGAGLPFDGLYFVKSVTHDIKRGEYKQSFQLARNALVSTFPTVPV